MAPSPAPRRPPYHNSINNSGADRIVWMAASPLLSPARDKNPKKKPARKPAIFAFRGRGKEEGEEEPTSPKVSCMGRVRNQGKSPHKSSGFDDSFQNRAPRSRTEDSSNGVFQKGEKSSIISRICELPCFSGLGPDANSGRKNGSDMGNGLISEPAMVIDPVFDANPAKDQKIVFRRSNSSRRGLSFEDLGGLYDPSGCKHVDNLESEKQRDVDQCKNHERAYDVPNSVSGNHADALHHENTEACDVNNHELGHPRDTNASQSEAFEQQKIDKIDKMIMGSCGKCNIDKRIDKASDVSHQAQHVLKHKLVYEDLPSLHSKRSPYSNLMVSFEVVPETWLSPDLQNGKQRRASRRSRKNGRGNSADEILNAALSVAKLTSFDHVPISYEQSKMSSSSDHVSAMTMDSDHAKAIENTSSNDCQNDQFGSLQTHKQPREPLSWRLSGLSKWLQMPATYKKNTSKGEDCFSLPLQKVDFKKLRALPPQIINSLILVGYNVNGQPDKFSNDEDYFQSPCRWLRSETQFIRSLSATTCRTVIQLKRCNSDPCRASS